MLRPGDTENHMSKRSRRNHSPAFRAKVALAAFKGDKTLSELAAHFDVRPTQITQWKAQLLERAADLFEGGFPTYRTAGRSQGPARQDWAAGAGERFFGRRAQQSGFAERKAMIDPPIAGRSPERTPPYQSRFGVLPAKTGERGRPEAHAPHRRA
jgi:transposase-like protein